MTGREEGGCETSSAGAAQVACAPVPSALLTVSGQRFYPGLDLPFTVVDGASLLSAWPEAPRFALCLIEAGSCVIRREGRELLLRSSSLLVLGETARPEFLTPRGLRCSMLYFHPQIVNSAFSDVAILRQGSASLSGSSSQDLYLFEPFLEAAVSPRIFLLSEGSHLRLAECFRKMAYLIREQPHDRWPCLARSYLIEALFLLRLVAQEGEHVEDFGPEHGVSRLDKALWLVHERFNEPLSLAEIARCCASNRTSLNAHFRLRTGMTMRAYLTELRMSMAANLLRDTRLPVAEIASRVGYENTSHFARNFRVLKGQTPSAYRESA